MNELLEQLHAAGQLEARGGFSIDPEKAREKLRQYQLADPRCYVLLLVEAANSSGAPGLEFEIDSDDLHLRFGGAVFSYEQLENIYGSLFASAEQRGDALRPEDLSRLRGLQQLAFALNSAMALNPRFARVMSVASDGSGTLLQLRPDQPDEISQVSEQRPGNWIHVKDRLRPGLIVEFFRSISDRLGEVELLRERCRWSRTPVFVNGKQISGPMSFSGEAWTEIDIVDTSDGGTTIGRAALGLREGDEQTPLSEPGAALVSNGVFIERRPLIHRGVQGFGAIVDSPRFGKDVSQTKLLHDAGYRAVLDAIISAQDQMITRLAERRVAGSAPAWADETLSEWLRKRAPKQLARALEQDQVFARVAEVPLWPVIGAAPISTRALIETNGPIRHASEDFTFVPVDVPFVLLASSGPAEQLLDQLFGARLFDYTSALRREAARQLERLQFMTRRQLPELGEGYYLIREAIEHTQREGEDTITIRGELGLRSLGQRDSWVRLVTEDCLLCERALDGLDDMIPGLCVVVSAPLSPNDAYDDAQPTPALAAALIAVLEALERAMTKLAQSGAVSAQHTELRVLLRIYVQQVCRHHYGVSLLSRFGLVRKQARRALEDRAIAPNWALDGPPELAHPLAHVPLYDRVEGPPRSLIELAARHAAGERLAWLELDAKTLEPGPLPVLDTEVLLLEQADREVLRELLGSDALAPYAERLAWIRRRDAFLERPEQTLQLAHASLSRVELAGDASDQQLELRGQLGLREYAFTAATDGHTPVSVYYRNRALCELDIELPLPGLTAWVESETFELSAMFESLRHPLSLRPALLSGIVALVEHQLARARAQPQDSLRCEWWWLAMVPGLVLGPGGLAQAFVFLRRQLEPAAALGELGGLLELLERFPGRDLDRGLGTLRGHGELPTATAVGARLKRPTRRLTEHERELVALRRALLPAFAALLELPLFHRLEGGTRSVSLDQLVVSVGAGQPISWVGEDFRVESLPDIEVEILRLDPIEHRLLSDMFGVEALELVSDWLIGRARFVRRRTISEIRVARGSALALLRVDEPDVRGELGLAREPPEERGRSRIRVFTQAREVTLLELPPRPLALVGALEFDTLELNAAHEDITAPERERIRRFVEARVDALLIELADRFEAASMDRRDTQAAARLVRLLLHEWPPGTGGYKARANRRRGLFRRLAKLPVFAGARKPWSAMELADAHSRTSITCIAYRRPKLELPDGPVVVLDADDVEGTLRALFGSLRDLEVELARAREIEQRKAAAQRMPSQAPKHALGKIEVEAEGLRGWLWLTEDQSQVLLGEDGHVAERRVISDLCRCAGVIWGHGPGDLLITGDWCQVSLTRPQERLLERLACELWDQLIDDFERRCDAEAPRDRTQRRSFVELRDALRGLFMRLHNRYGSHRSKRRKHKHNKGGDRYQRLYARVSAVPVLELSTGRWISAEIAERERPIELASLQLWTGPSAEELAHQRKVERREAERARELQREQEQAQERARRRAEAEARAREAERRRQADQEAREQAKREQARKSESSKAKAKSSKAKSSKAKSSKSRRQAPPPRPELLLLEALREELRLVRASNDGLVSNRHLESLVLGEAKARGPLFRHTDGVTEIDVGHSLFQAVLDGYLGDQSLLTLLASSAYTYLNIIHVEIEDQHEAEFLRLHAAHAATGLGA